AVLPRARRPPFRKKSNVLLSLAVVCLFAASSTSYGQTPPAAGPNSDPLYQQLRNIGLGGESVTVSNFELKRDAATFHLHSGTVCFAAPVNGKVTSAVFVGAGNMLLDAPSLDEA